jgi:hypothetical protein
VEGIKMIEVIEFNINTKWRKVHRFDDLNKAIDFIKKRRVKLEDGYTYTICDFIEATFYID